MANIPMKAANSRVFLIEGRANPQNSPSYESCFRMTGISQSFGDIERVECPDPYTYGQFVEVAQIKGASERVTTTLEGRYYMDVVSTILRLARKGCAIDVQLHFGQCEDPSDFDDFTKALVIEEAYLTSYSTDDLGALQSADNAVVNETADLSGTRVYEVRPLTFAEKAASVVTNEVIDIVVSDTQSCGTDCETESDGCQKIYALTIAAGGSPSTPADIVYSLDGGSTWYARDVDTLGASDAPDELDVIGSYLVVVSNATQSYHYALKSELTATGVPSWTEVAIATQAPNAIHSVGARAFIVGDAGYVWLLGSPASGVTVLDAGSATSEQLNAVHAMDEDFAVAVGNNGAVIYTQNQTLWSAATVPVASNLNAVWMKSKTTWIVGAANGNLYYTTDTGTTWTTLAFTGSGSGSVADIAFATDSVGFVSHTTAGGAGRLLRTYSGGNSWVVLPEGSTTLPSNQRLNKIAPCKYDANTVFAGGLSATTDGIIIQGEAS